MTARKWTTVPLLGGDVAAVEVRQGALVIYDAKGDVLTTARLTPDEKRQLAAVLLMQDERRPGATQRLICVRCLAGEEAVRTVSRGWVHKLGGGAGLYDAVVPCRAAVLWERGRNRHE